MLEAIALSAATVWVIGVLMVVMLFIATANESLSLAFWTTVIGLAAFQFLSEANPWAYVKANPTTLGLAALAYVPLGIGWSIFRWWRLLQNKATELRAYRPKWAETVRPGSSWVEYVRKQMPTASSNKSRISCWIAYWPFSIAAYLAVDFLYEIGNWIYVQISGLYQRMADRVQASILKD